VDADGVDVDAHVRRARREQQRASRPGHDRRPRPARTTPFVQRVTGSGSAATSTIATTTAETKRS
jgi:hypothetical protein